MSDSSENVTPRLDAARRLERVIDAQSATLERIDDKSGRIARLLGILLGVVLSSVSLSTQLTGVSVKSISIPTQLVFLVSLSFLLLSLSGAVVTLLSNRYKIGLGHGVGVLLSRDDYDVSTENHLRRVLGTYARNVKLNYRIIEVNARRFQRTLSLFLLGLFYLGFSAVLVLIGLTETIEWVLVMLTIPVSCGIGWFVLSGSYLPMQEEMIHND